MTPSGPTWPPPPNLPHPLRGHDTFLTACIIESQVKPPLSRLRLISLLRKETGMSLRECKAFVDDYCDRQAILMPLRGLKVWLSLLPSTFMLVTFLSGAIIQNVLYKAHDAARTRAERLVISHEADNVALLAMILMIVLVVINMVVVVRRGEQNRRDAAEAREKVRLRQSMVGILHEATRTERPGPSA